MRTAPSQSASTPVPGYRRLPRPRSRPPIPRTFALGGAAVALIGLSAGAGVVTPAADSRAGAPFRGNLQNTGVFDTGAVYSIGVLKRFEGGWGQDSLLSTPVMAEGVAYFSVVGPNTHPPPPSSAFHAIDLRSGRELWRQEEAGEGGAAAIVGGLVYCRGRELFAMDRKTGEIRWRVKGVRGGRGAPAVAEGAVYVADRGIRAFDAATGRERWHTVTGSRYLVSPTYGDGVLYTGDGDGNVFAVDARTGSMRWQLPASEQRKPPGEIEEPLTVADGVVYVAANLSLLALDAGEGDVLWRVEDTDLVKTAPTVYAGIVFYGSEGLLRALDAETGRPVLELTRRAGGETKAAPVVADGIVYFTGSDYRESDRGRTVVHAFDMAARRFRWRTTVPGTVWSELTIHDGWLCFGSHEGRVGHLWGIRDGGERALPPAPPVVYAPTTILRGNLARTGVYNTRACRRLGGVRWRKRLKGRVEWMTVASGRLFVQSQYGFKPQLLCLDARTGEEVHTLPALGTWGSPTIHAGQIYACEGNGLVAFDLATSRRHGGCALPGCSAGGSPAVAGRSAYLATGAGLAAVDLDAGLARWQFQTQSSTAGAAAVVDGTVYVGSRDCQIYAVDALSGAPKWKYETDGPIPFGGTPAVTDGLVYVASEDGHLYALNAATGAPEWTCEAPPRAAACADGLVFFAGGGREPYLRAVDSRTGASRWRRAMRSGPSSAPTVAEGVVHVGTSNGTLYAFDGPSGAVLWTFRTEDPIRGEAVIQDGVVYLAASGGYDDHEAYVYALSEDGVPEADLPPAAPPP